MVSIITINYNGKHFLKRHYDSLLSQSYANKELIFVENGSSDGSFEFIRNNYPEVKIVRIDINQGPVKAYNLGASYSSNESKYIVLVGNDTWFDNDWLFYMTEQMEEDENIAVCGAKQMTYNGNMCFSNSVVTIDVFGYPIPPRSNDEENIFYVDGVSFFVRKVIWDVLGGFDERYFMFHEEIDFCWRLKLLGYKIKAVEKAVFYHKLGGTVKSGYSDSNEKYATTLFKRYHGEKNNLCNLLKNYSFKTLTLIVPVYLSINIIEMCFFLIQLKFDMFLVYPKAWFWNMTNSKETMKKRKKIQSHRAKSDLSLMKHMYKGSGKLKMLTVLGNPKVV